MFVPLQIRALCCAAATACTRKEGVCAWQGGRGQSVTWRKVSVSIPPAPTMAPASRVSAYAVLPTRVLTVNKVRSFIRPEVMIHAFYRDQQKRLRFRAFKSMTLLFLKKVSI